MEVKSFPNGYISHDEREDELIIESLYVDVRGG
jgi:hypothetical protein